jgi:hypothetical protein
MPRQPVPFTEGATTANTGEAEQLHLSDEYPFTSGTEQAETRGINVYITMGSETPQVGKPYGTDKPRRVMIRGKSSK